MRRTIVFIALLSASVSFAAPPREEAIRSLLGVRAAAEAAAAAAGRGAFSEAASLGAGAFDHAGSAAAEPVAAAAAAGPSRQGQVLAPAQRQGVRLEAGVSVQPLQQATEAELEPGKPADAGFPGKFLGLYPSSDFELTTGRCDGCRAPKEGLWYFLDDVIAVPKAGTPSIVWIGSHAMIEGARLSADGTSVTLPDGSSVPLDLVSRIATNRSYYDASTTAFLRGRPLRLRGEWVEQDGVRRFVARTIWPEDFRVDFGGLSASPASGADDITKLIKEDEGGAKSPFKAVALWERAPPAGRAWAGKPVLGVMLNGGQGDDDEALGGHFSFFTGRFGPNGEMADWVFSNFYDLAHYSEKGILPSLVPMDKYMADLNSGQSYYRPTDMLVAVLKDERAALEMQEKFKDLYVKYYAHEVVYNHTTKSCAGLVMDEVRQDGWNIPTSGSSNLLAAGALSAIVAIGGWDRKAGEEMFATMRQERTRLFPRAAFEAAGADLLRLGGAQGQAPGRELTPWERELQADLEAVLFVRIPQIPSSRAFGSYPVASTEEYMGRVPLDHSKWKTVPSVPRPYPPPH